MTKSSASPPSPQQSSKSDNPRPTRAIARQATSAVAHVAEPPEEDDPLLGFAPYLHTAPRRNSITPDLQRRFIATLAATGIVKQAAKSIGKSLEALYKLRKRPGAEGFDAAWDEALERGVQRLEDCALERALQGTSTPIVSQGEILGWWDKPDNALLRFLLQHRLPHKYGKGSDRTEEEHAEIRDAIRKDIMQQALAWADDQLDTHMEHYHAVLNHMVANRRAGLAAITGLDKSKSLYENAQMLKDPAERDKAEARVDDLLRRLGRPRD